MSKTYLLADSGSTKTDWLVADSSGILCTFSSSGFNPFYQSAQAIDEVLVQEVLPQLTSFQPDEIHFYGAGCANEAVSRPIRDSLARYFPAASLISVESDLLAAARALCGREAGIACILGTGANNALYDGHTIRANIGSLGFWLGDEGSGGYLGKEWVVRFLHRELPVDLAEAFATAYPGVDRFSVLENAYHKPFPNRYFAGFTRFLGQHATHPYVQQFVLEAFLLFLTKYVSRHAEASMLPVSFTGSIAYYFQEQLAEALCQKGLWLGSIQKSPIEGLFKYHIEN